MIDFMTALPILSGIGKTLMGAEEERAKGSAYALKGVRSAYAGEHEAREVKFANEYEAKERKFASTRKARLLRERGAKEKAVARIRGDEEVRKAELVMSSLLARGAAGGDASDPMIMRMMANVADEGAYRKSIAIYEGEQAAYALEIDAISAEHDTTIDKSALSAEYKAKIAGIDSAAGQRASRISAGQTLVGGGISLFEKYGGDLIEEWNS